MRKEHEVGTIEEFYVHALALETEAAERYQVLAAQMHSHNNAECARLFEHLAVLELEHTAGLRHNARSKDLKGIPPWSYRWLEPESPESTPLDRVHYLMTPFHALQLALTNEKRAKEFFERAATHSPSQEVRTLAQQYAAEEQRHIEMVSVMLRRAAAPPPDWNQDHDRAVEPE